MLDSTQLSLLSHSEKDLPQFSPLTGPMPPPQKYIDENLSGESASPPPRFEVLQTMRDRMETFRTLTERSGIDLHACVQLLSIVVDIMIGAFQCTHKASYPAPLFLLPYLACSLFIFLLRVKVIRRRLSSHLLDLLLFLKFFWVLGFALLTQSVCRVDASIGPSSAAEEAQVLKSLNAYSRMNVLVLRCFVVLLVNITVNRLFPVHLGV